MSGKIRQFGRAMGNSLLLTLPVLVMGGCAYTIPGGNESLLTLLSSASADGISTATIAVTNLRDGGTNQSGFLNGTVTAGNVAAVEVAVNSGAYTPATGTTNWSWQLPTGAAGLRLGTSYTLSIRARDIFGNSSHPTSFTMRKGINKDVNGDGYPDLMVGAPTAAGGGRAYIFYGGPSGPGTRNASAADTVITAEGGGFFAVGVLLADVNGDGYADAVTGDITVGNGRVYIFHSRGSAGIASAGAGTANAIISAHTTGLSLGSKFAAGDLNNDGYTDLAVRVGGGNDSVYLFPSTGSAGIPTQLTSAASAVISDTASSTGLGNGIDLGDVNGDGFADLLASAHLAAGFDGRAYVFLSAGAALTSRTTTAADATITGESVSRMGTTALLADLNNDGYQDIVVSSNQHNSSTGRVYIFYSAGSAAISSGPATGADVVISGETNSQLGANLAAGDVDGDGATDLMIAAGTYPAVATPFGRAYIFYSAGSLTTGNAAALAGTFLTGGLTGQAQSAGDVALIDLNGDGYPDALTGSNNSTAVADEVHYFRAPGSGIIASQDLGSGGAADAVLSGETVNDRFGLSMAR